MRYLPHAAVAIVGPSAGHRLSPAGPRCPITGPKPGQAMGLEGRIPPMRSADNLAPGTSVNELVTDDDIKARDVSYSRRNAKVWRRFVFFA